MAVSAVAVLAAEFEKTFPMTLSRVLVIESDDEQETQSDRATRDGSGLRA